MNAPHDIFYDNVKRIRKEKAMSQQEVADKAEMLVSTLSRLERGMSSPSLSTMRRVANALGVDVTALLQTKEITNRTLLEKFQMIELLPEHDRGVIEILIDTVLEKNRLEHLQDQKMKNRLAELDKVRK